MIAFVGGLYAPNASLQIGLNQRDGKWTESIAARDKYFVMKTKAKPGARARGRRALENMEGFELKESQNPCNHVVDPEKGTLRLGNHHFGTISS